jgi:hypothetical protein
MENKFRLELIFHEAGEIFFGIGVIFPEIGANKFNAALIYFKVGLKKLNPALNHPRLPSLLPEQKHSFSVPAVLSPHHVQLSKVLH